MVSRLESLPLQSDTNLPSSGCQLQKNVTDELLWGNFKSLGLQDPRGRTVGIYLPPTPSLPRAPTLKLCRRPSGQGAGGRACSDSNRRSEQHLKLNT